MPRRLHGVLVRVDEPRHEVDRLLGFASRVDFSEPERNEEAIYAMNFCIVQIKEHVSYLSEDFQKRRLGIQLSRFADFRNVLVHEYGQTDYSAYEDLVRGDMRQLKRNLEAYLNS